MEFESLLKNISCKITAIAARIDGRSPFLDKDDLYQEAVLHLWEEFKKGSLQGKTTSYILQNCYFFLKNYLRTAAKGVDRNSQSLEKIVADGDLSLEEVIAVHSRQEVRHSLERNILVKDIRSRINGSEEKVFSLYLEGFTTREIGSRLGISHVRVVKLNKGIRDRYKVYAERF